MATTIHQYNNSDYAFAQERLQQYVRRGRITQAQLDQMMHHLQTLETKGQLASGIDEAGNVKSNAAIYAYKMVQAKELLHPEEYVGKNKERVSDKVGGNHREALNTLYRADADENALAEAAKSVAGVENLITTRGQTNLAVHARGMSFNRQGKAGFETIELQDGQTSQSQTSQNEGQKDTTVSNQTPTNENNQPPIPDPRPINETPNTSEAENKTEAQLREQIKQLEAQSANLNAQNTALKNQLESTQKENERLTKENTALQQKAAEISAQTNTQQPQKDPHIDDLVYGKPKLVIACQDGKTDEVKDLLAKGANPNAKEIIQGNTPLYFAKNAEVAQVLIANGADANAQNQYGSTPLHLAKNAEVAKVLIENGANVHAQNKYGSTPLHYARNAEVAKVLIANGADVHAKDANGKTPLHYADYNVEVAQTLINAGADVHAKDANGQTPLHATETAEVAKVLIDNKAEVNIKDKYDQTPLHFAKNAEVAQALINAGADVHAQRDDGSTPLHFAKYDEVAKVLINAGADVHAQNKYGSTPLHYAKNAEVAQVLIDKGADVHAKDNNGQTPQSYIASKVSQESDHPKKVELQAALNVINQAQKNTPQAQKVATQPNNAQAQTNTKQTKSNLITSLGKSSRNVTEELDNTQGISLDTSHSMANSQVFNCAYLSQGQAKINPLARLVYNRNAFKKIFVRCFSTFCNFAETCPKSDTITSSACSACCAS